MIRCLGTPAGPEFEPDGMLYPVLAYARTTDGREVCVRQRMYNTIITIGPIGENWYQDHW